MGLIQKWKLWKATVEGDAIAAFEDGVTEEVASTVTSSATDADIRSAVTAWFDRRGFPPQDDATLRGLVDRVRKQVTV